MPMPLDTSSARGRDQRRLGREKRREAAASAAQTAEPSASNDAVAVGSAQDESEPDTVKRPPPRALLLIGAAVGVVAGVLIEQRRRKQGNEISGDVAVHLLNKIELLTIRLQVRQARRAGSAEIDVHHAGADASS